MFNSNINPYYDDFDETKGFHQILFRPGLAVQARELTQLQSIIANQINRFGSHIFKEGSIVTGGGVSTSFETTIEILPTLVDGVTVFKCEDYSLPGLNVICNGFVGKVLLAENFSETSPNNKITVQLESNGEISEIDDIILFVDDEALALYHAESNFTSVLTSNIVKPISPKDTFIASVDNGVAFAKGSFIYHELQRIVLERNDSASLNIIVGFNIKENIVTAFDDLSLLDPAQGSYNYAAPGADRLSRWLDLTFIPWDDTTNVTVVGSADFIEVLRVKEGIPYITRRVPVYSGIEDTMARRTYDESGHYVIRPFIPAVHPIDPVLPTFNIEVSAGKAYVKGYEIEKHLPTTITVNKAIDFESVFGLDIPTAFGNYTTVTHTTSVGASLFNINNPSLVELHSSVTPGSATLIGTAFVRSFAVTPGAANNFDIYLFDIKLTGPFANCRSIKYEALILPIATSAIIGNNAQLFKTDLMPALFKLPQSNIRSTENFEFYTLRSHSNNIVASDSITITTAGGNERFSGGIGAFIPSSIVNTLYTVFNNQTGTFIDMSQNGRSVEVIVVSANSAASAILRFPNDTFNGDNISVISVIEVSNLAPRTKTIVAESTAHALSGLVEGTKYSLGMVDVIKPFFFVANVGASTNEHNIFSGTYDVVDGLCTINFTFTYSHDSSKTHYFIFNNESLHSEIFTPQHSLDDNTLTFNVPFASGAGTVTIARGTLLPQSDMMFNGGQTDTYYDVASFTATSVANILVYQQHMFQSLQMKPLSWVMFLILDLIEKYFLLLVQHIQK